MWSTHTAIVIVIALAMMSQVRMECVLGALLFFLGIKTLLKALPHHGSNLKRRKTINPNPKLPEQAHSRDLVGQNKWIRENLLDGMGNYLFCVSCIRSALSVSKQRPHKQREVKQKLNQDPIVEMKKEVEKQRLGDYVIMPEEVASSFLKWRRSIEPTTLIKVRFPHERHGLAGKTSNAAKVDVCDDFLTFVDLNSQPNGRSADSSGPTFYFLPNFYYYSNSQERCKKLPRKVQMLSCWRVHTNTRRAWELNLKIINKQQLDHTNTTRKWLNIVKSSGKQSKTLLTDPS